MQEDEEMYVVPAYGTKVCPQCGQTLFDDMDVCYGCLYEFGKETEEDVQTSLDVTPPLSKEVWLEDEVPTEAYERGWVSAEDAVEAPAEAKDTPRLWLRIRSGDMEVSVPLPKQGLLVGRGADCDVVLRGRSVSRKHVLIVPAGEGVLVRNQDATNPALLGDQKVMGEAAMHLEEELNVCGTTFKLMQV